MPYDNGTKNYALNLVKVDIFTSDFEVTLASDGSAADVDYGTHYRGIVNGDPYSVVAVSIYNKEVMGLIAVDGGNYVLGKLDGSEFNGEHIIYNDKYVEFDEPWECHVPDDGVSYKKKDLEWDETRSPGDCIRLYIEVDHDIYNDKGGTTGATNFITGLMNEVITLYANESIASVVISNRCLGCYQPVFQYFQ